MSHYKLAAFLSVPVLILMGVGSAASPPATADRAAVLETKMALRDLWVEHVFWIRSYVLATHAHDEAQSKIAHTRMSTCGPESRRGACASSMAALIRTCTVHRDTCSPTIVVLAMMAALLPHVPSNSLR